MKNRHRICAATFPGTINTFVAFFLNGYAELDDNACQSLVRQFSRGIYF